MHTDARTLEDGSVIEGDICIIGAGAAGISMALEWKDTPYKVILLEGGSFQVEPRPQALYDGESVGQTYYPLQAVRLRAFGGTTGHWAGWCSPFEPLDFKKRDWVPDSGWPIDRAALDAFYPRAHSYVEIGPYAWDAAYWEAQDPDRQSLAFDKSRVWTKMWQFSPPTRFGLRYRDDIFRAENIHLYSNANVTRIDTNETAANVEGLTVRTFEGKTFSFRAKHYVMACGAWQNARLLLASNDRAPAGLGNQNDLVGRYFMEHLEVMCASMLLVNAPASMKMYEMKFFETKARGELSLSEEAQAENEVLNLTVTLHPRTLEPKDYPWLISRYPSDARFTVDRLDELQAEYEGAPGGAQTPDYLSGLREFQLQARMEQSPNRDSRVFLARETDELGMPRLTLDWRLTALEKHSLRRTFEVIGEEAGKVGLGRVQLLDWLTTDDPMWTPNLGGGWHHMGTTRMHDDPKQGVVDPNGTVHGIHNLHVASSSTFTTAGASNPTLTIIAMTMRLSDRLKGMMG
ncbi:MAG: GMC family oxidoreductase [Rhodothermales bacterium]|nr:GMC family oxidoreductase [Rhodothermales bacterium]